MSGQIGWISAGQDLGMFLREDVYTYDADTDTDADADADDCF